MTTSLAILALALAGAVATVLWYRERARTRAAARLDGLLYVEAQEPAFESQREAVLATFPPRHRWIPFVTGLLVLAGTRLIDLPRLASRSAACSV
jgi:hypothetical protein